MKYFLFIIILIFTFHIVDAEGINNENGQEENTMAPTDTATTTSNSISGPVISKIEYQIRYQSFKSDFTSLDNYDPFDLDKRRKKKRRRKGTIDESLIYFSAGTGILMLTPTILSAVDRDVSMGGALAADFILAGILTYAILKEMR